MSNKVETTIWKLTNHVNSRAPLTFSVFPYALNKACELISSKIFENSCMPKVDTRFSCKYTKLYPLNINNIEILDIFLSKYNPIHIGFVLEKYQ